MAAVLVTVISANLVKDDDWLGKMDPYVILEAGGHKVETQVASGQGTNPSWNQQFSFTLGQNAQLKVRVYDSDVGPDEFLGEVDVDLRAYSQGGVREQGFPITNKSGRPAGLVQLRIEANSAQHY